MPIPHRIAPLTAPPCRGTVSCRISPDFSGLSVCAGQVAYALLTRAPVAGKREQALSPDAPRLACVRPVASVHPEPGSNSPLFVFSLNLFRLLVRIPKARSSLYLALNWLEALFLLMLLYYSCLFNHVNVLRFCFGVRFVLKSECKVMRYFRNLQIFLRTFFEGNML